MASTTNVPDILKPYVSLGVLLDIPQDTTGVGSVYGDCPWCGKEGKFNITLSGEKVGVWRCNACNIGNERGGGNVFTFLRVLHDLSMKATPHDDYVKLAAQRRILFAETLKTWGLCRSVIDGVWIVPGYSVQNGTREGGKIVTMYRYTKLAGADKPSLCVTSKLSHGLIGPDIPTPKGGLQVTRRQQTGPVYRCEGLWDAMALYEVALRSKMTDEDRLAPTSNHEASLLWTGSVIAVPGAGIFNPQWASVMAGRPDYSLYHNDHPKERPPGSGKMIQAGLDGTQKAIGILASASTPPKECKYLRWGQNSFHDPNLPSGYDVRDHLSGPDGKNGLIARIRALNDLLHRLQPIPADWLSGRDAATVAAGKLSLQEEECRDWKTLLNALRGVLKVTPGIERVFASCLASVLSVPTNGDQLWLMIVGPPSSAKSTIAEAVSTNRQYVLPKDTLTGLFSGWQMGLEKNENLSMAGEMQNKTLVIKDADTVLQSPQCAQIMSQLRALYDRAVRTQYKNRMSKDWEGLNTTVLLFGTATLYQLDAAERGARYLTVDIEPHEDHDLEDEITRRVAHSAFRSMKIHANGTPQSRTTPEETKLRQLTAGYIRYLRENGMALIDAVEDPTGEALETCGNLATFVSYMRCRPPKKQNEKVEREKPYRLTKQLVRLAQGLAVVFNKRRMDDKVMDHVRNIALNTAQGRVLDICDYIRACGPGGVASQQIGLALGKSHDEIIDTLRFLRKVGAVEMRTHSMAGSVRVSRPRWLLAPRLSRLYDRIFGPLAPAGVGMDSDADSEDG